MRHHVAMTRIKVPSTLYRRMIDEACATPELEVCGLLAGFGNSCTALYPVKNVSPTPERTFYMDPQSQISAMATMRQCGQTMVGIYHSHPTTPATPSARDLSHAAYPGVAYVIVSLHDRKQPEVAAFILEQGRFRPLQLAIEPGDDPG